MVFYMPEGPPAELLPATGRAAGRPNRFGHLGQIKTDDLNDPKPGRKTGKRGRAAPDFARQQAPPA
jgi:hypothetical protein